MSLRLEAANCGCVAFFGLDLLLTGYLNVSLVAFAHNSGEGIFGLANLNGLFVLGG